MRNLTELGLSLERYRDASSLYTGGVVNNLGDGKITEVADTVSRELAERPSTMIGFSTEELVQGMKEGRASVALDSFGNLTAFAQYWPYKVDGMGDDFLRDLKLFEIGSWLRFGPRVEKNLGRKVFEACLAVGEMKHPDAGFIAIVERRNKRASGIVKTMGGEWIGRKRSKQLRSPFTDYPKMNIYRMTRR